MFFRIVGITLVILLCLGFTGCGNPSDQNAAAQPINPEPAQTTASAGTKAPEGNNTEDTVSKYTDGVYEGKSNLTSEGYYGKSKVTVKQGRIQSVDFEIYDTSVFKTYGNSKHKKEAELLLDETYGKEVYEKEPIYQEQTKNELSGMKKYGLELVEEQEVEKVDMISGATWSYSIFCETMEDTLKKARK